jgi:hypothetical protein
MKKICMNNEKKIVKFIEALWRTIFYASFVVVGVHTLLYPDIQIWVSDPRNLYYGWPLHQVTDKMMFYYMIEFGSYIHQLMWTEVSRSDSLEMMAHHMITLSMMLFSHLTNVHRWGTMVLILHDIADVFLEFAKCFHYMSKAPGWEYMQTMCNIVFGGFVISFFITRLVIYPDLIFVSLWTDGFDYFNCNMWGIHIIFWLLCALFCLHVFWFYLTVRMIQRLLGSGDDKGDVRSDGEEDDGMGAYIHPKDTHHTNDGNIAIARKKTKKMD